MQKIFKWFLDTLGTKSTLDAFIGILESLAANSSIKFEVPSLNMIKGVLIIAGLMDNHHNLNGWKLVVSGLMDDLTIYSATTKVTWGPEAINSLKAIFAMMGLYDIPEVTTPAVTTPVVTK